MCSWMKMLDDYRNSPCFSTEWKPAASVSFAVCSFPILLLPNRRFHFKTEFVESRGPLGLCESLPKRQENFCRLFVDSCQVRRNMGETVFERGWRGDLQSCHFDYFCNLQQREAWNARSYLRGWPLRVHLSLLVPKKELYKWVRQSNYSGAPIKRHAHARMWNNAHVTCIGMEHHRTSLKGMYFF